MKPPDQDLRRYFRDYADKSRLVLHGMDASVALLYLQAMVIRNHDLDLARAEADVIEDMRAVLKRYEQMRRVE